MTDQPVWPYPMGASMVEVRVSLRIEPPGASPIFLEGMKLVVDRYMYECYRDIGELNEWLQWQATDLVMKNGKLTHVAIIREGM